MLVNPFFDFWDESLMANVVILDRCSPSIDFQDKTGERTPYYEAVAFGWVGAT